MNRIPHRCPANCVRFRFAVNAADDALFVSLGHQSFCADSSFYDVCGASHIWRTVLIGAVGRAFRSEGKGQNFAGILLFPRFHARTVTWENWKRQRGNRAGTDRLNGSCRRSCLAGLLRLVSGRHRRAPVTPRANARSDRLLFIGRRVFRGRRRRFRRSSGGAE